jgi:hypothetical protein
VILSSKSATHSSWFIALGVALAVIVAALLVLMSRSASKGLAGSQDPTAWQATSDPFINGQETYLEQAASTTPFQLFVPSTAVASSANLTAVYVAKSADEQQPNPYVQVALIYASTGIQVKFEPTGSGLNASFAPTAVDVAAYAQRLQSALGPSVQYTNVGGFPAVVKDVGADAQGPTPGFVATYRANVHIVVMGYRPLTDLESVAASLQPVD